MHISRSLHCSGGGGCPCLLGNPLGQKEHWRGLALLRKSTHVLAYQHSGRRETCADSCYLAALLSLKCVLGETASTNGG